MKKVSAILCVVMTAILLLSGCKKEKDPVGGGNGNDTPTFSSAKKILTFKFVDLNVVADVDNNERTVTATVPYGTDVRTLAPVITVSPKATITPASGEAVDFTNPVTYTVTAEDGSQVDYTATVTMEASDQPLVGTWGVEKIEYYNTDYAGNPIAASMVTYLFDPNDTNNGIQLVFREDRTGELRDSAVDTIWTDWNEQTYIVNPDTVMVYSFRYSYDESEHMLYMNMEYGTTFRMDINELTPETFIYVNEYEQNYVEKAYLKRISFMPTKSEKPVGQQRPTRSGSMLGKR